MFSSIYLCWKNKKICWKSEQNNFVLNIYRLNNNSFIWSLSYATVVSFLDINCVTSYGSKVRKCVTQSSLAISTCSACHSKRINYREMSLSLVKFLNLLLQVLDIFESSIIFILWCRGYRRPSLSLKRSSVFYPLLHILALGFTL